MVSRVILYKKAKDELSELPRTVQLRIARAIDDLERFPEVKTGTRKLKSPFQGYRKRVGNLRILFDFEDGLVYVRKIMDRKDAYR